MIISKAEELKATIDSNDNVLVDFFATWCGPCKMIAPVLDQLATEETSVKIVKVDVDQFEDLTEQWGVNSMPTLVWVKNGKEVTRKSGYMAKEAILEVNKQSF